MNRSSKTILRQLLSKVNNGQSIGLFDARKRYAYDIAEYRARLSPSGERSSRIFLERTDPRFIKNLRLFESTAAAATFSPHRPLIDTPYYVKTQTLDDLDVLIPDPEGYILHHNVVHYGPKGSGKTTVQNQWLKSRHELLEQRKCLYIRCDAPKLFDFFSQQDTSLRSWDPDFLPSIQEYLDLQMVYILGKRHEVGLPQQIVNMLEDEQIIFGYKEARAVDSPLRTNKPISWYLKTSVYQSIKLFESGDIDKSYVRDSLFKDKKTQRREYFRWMDCAGAIKSWLKENGYIILHILDGIDNLHLNTDAGKRAYEAFLPHAANFLLRKPSANEIRFGVTRERTWIDMTKTDPVITGSTTVIIPRPILHSIPATNTVTSERISWLNSQDGYQDFPSDSEARADWMRTHEHTTSEVIKAAVSVMPPQEVLHSNIRTLISGTATLACQIRFRAHQLGMDIDYRRQAATQMKRNLFLNGRFYLSTERDWPIMNREQGIPFFNPFWFPNDHIISTSGQDPLFLRIRLLEYLTSGDMVDSDIKYHLINTFRYDPEHINIAIDDARAYGWIDSRFKNGDSSNIIYEISPTGRYLLTDLLHDIDVLYMLALDTLVPEIFFDRMLISVHSNHIHHRSEYISTAVTTVLSFLIYLSALNKIEAESNNAIKDKKYSSYFLNNKFKKSLMTKLINMSRSTDRVDQEKIIAYINRLNALV